jgi:hypothetical protein
MRTQDQEAARLRDIVAEQRVKELVKALRHAVIGYEGWRTEARDLLALIDGGVPPTPRHSVEFQTPPAAA